MAMYGYVLLCMAMYDYVWLCMAMYGYVWLCMAMHGYMYGYVLLWTYWATNTSTQIDTAIIVV